MSLVILAAIATFFNFIIILWKVRTERYLDAMLDTSILFAIAYLYQGTVTGMQIGMIASMLVSLYLLIKPPKFPDI